MDTCNYHNSQRAADWRWFRAAGILEGRHPRPSLQRDGEQGCYWIKQALRFRREYNACTNDLQRYVLAERRTRAPLYWAHAMYADDSPMKYTVEALILAREDNYGIGFRCGMDPKTIEAYESVFFNVRDRLQHPEVIVKCITRRAIEHGMYEREYDLLWKLYAYFYGPEMLQAVSHRFVNPMWVQGADTVGTAIENDAIATLKLKAMLAAKTVPVNAQTQMDLLNAFTQFVEVERSSESTHKAENQLLEHVMAMMTQLPFDVAGRDPRQEHALVDRGLTAKYRQTAVELTFEENLRGATGQPLPEAEMLLDVRYPPRLAAPQAGG